MAFVDTDPRGKLKGLAGTPTNGEMGGLDFANFYESAPEIESDVEKTWLTRGQSFVVAYSILKQGAAVRRDEQLDEYVILLPDNSVTAKLTSGSQTCEIPARSLVIVPPGASEVQLETTGRLVRIFSTAAVDLAQRSVNADSYQSPKPNVAPFEPWPAPPGGYRVRIYSLDVEPEPGRFGRIWRSTNLMINFSEPRPGPRDVTKMSPHVHEDFEQGSLVLEGSFVHHVRWPWGTDLRFWRQDEHAICAGPSLAVIPPKSVHTSQQVSQGINQLVDIFAPPRFDFSEVEGWVLNANEYPMPLRGNDG